MPSKSIPAKCTAAVFSEVGRPLELRQFDVPQVIDPGGALCKVLMATICGSDLHTISGRRTEPTPLILGHEILGEIVALGDGLTHDATGQPLLAGDRVSWTVIACCGECFFCAHGLPQKCERLRKYGHTCCDEWPHLTGGFAEYVCLMPGTAIFRVPDGLPDEIATPANCALATVINAMETIGFEAGENVLIQGAGLLGLNLIALCKQAGAASVAVTDVNAERLTMAERFGADVCLDLSGRADADALSIIADATDGRGVDVAFEVCGVADAVDLAVRALRTGGRYLIAGLVSPGQQFTLDGNQLTRKCLTIKGIHNYRPEHLGRALEFLQRCAEKYPYADIIGATFPLSRINQAVAEAAAGKHIRVAVKP